MAARRNVNTLLWLCPLKSFDERGTRPCAVCLGFARIMTPCRLDGVFLEGRIVNQSSDDPTPACVIELRCKPVTDFML